MPEGACNKCGEYNELVLEGCVCRSCSEALDNLWGDFAATDWVLIATHDSVLRGIMEQSSPERLEEWLSTRFRHLNRNATYAEMKSQWATWSRGSDDRSIGPASPDDIGRLALLYPAWANQRDIPIIRPATTDEIVKHDKSLRSGQMSKEMGKIAAKWGFDDEGRPLEGIWDDEARRRAARAYEETRTRVEQLGLAEEWKDLQQSVEQYKAFERSGVGIDEFGSTRPSSRPPHEGSPEHGLAQVAGMSDLKEQLMQEVIGPFKDPDLHRRYRVSLPNGILLYGPPGCGKTYIARALADELGWSFQYCRPSDVASPFIHDTVSRIRAIFSTAIEKAPSIVFIDEFEAFVPARSELGSHQQYKAEEVNEFLANLEGCAERKVLVIAATNEPEKIDPAVRRSGRFDKLILIPPPDAEARRAMLDFHLDGRPVEESVNTAAIAAVLEGFAASDIKLLVDEAARMALRAAELISTHNLLTALDRVPSSITAEDMHRYSAFRSRGTV